MLKYKENENSYGFAINIFKIRGKENTLCIMFKCKNKLN